MKRWPGWVLLVLVVVGALAVGASRADGPSTPAERAEAIEQRIACPVCDGESVFESRNTASENIRTAIRSYVDAGELSDDEIVGVVESRFGGQVLLIPKASGFDALVWALPVAALVCAIAGLAVTFRRWRREARAVANRRGPGAGAAALTDDDRYCVPRPRRPLLAARSLAPSLAARNAMSPDRLAELEDERRFLLRSLRDLDAELDAGDVDIDDYATLRDGYTKRAADVLRDISKAKAALPARPPVRWSRRLAIAGVVLLVALGAGWLVARSSGQRLGDDDSVTAGGPDDVAVVLAQARALIAADPVRAQSLYAQVLEARPDHPEALAYSGFLLFDASAGASEELRQTAVSAARAATGQGRRGRPAVRRPALLPGRDRRRRRRARDGPTRARPVPRSRPPSSTACAGDPVLTTMRTAARS